MTEAMTATVKILDALETYKSNHNMRYGSITDDLLDALIEINKLNKENEENKKSLRLVVEDRDSQVKMYVEQNKILQNEKEALEKKALKVGTFEDVLNEMDKGEIK